MAREKKIKAIRITTAAGLQRAEKENRRIGATEILPWAVNTPFEEITETIFPDKNGEWKTPVFMTITKHEPSNGAYILCRKAEQFISDKFGSSVDVLSISSYMEDASLVLVTLVRSYMGTFHEFINFFKYIGESVYTEEDVYVPTPGQLIIPDEIKNFSYPEEVERKHTQDLKKQNEILEHCDREHPFLNSMEDYTPQKLPRPEDGMDFVYDLESNDKQIKLVTPYEQFQTVFREIVSRLSSGTDKYSYFAVLKGEKNKDAFLSYINQVVDDEYVKTGRLMPEDKPALNRKLNKALFKLYVVQDLIDDPNVTDIKITAPDSIRARVKGKAYISNVTFIDENDYRRFVDALAIRNGISQDIPSQTFTDTGDDNYVLRFSITAEYVNSVPYPYVHIRKVSRKKLMGDKLIEYGMMTKKVQDYLLDCGKTSRGVVFAGPPGSGKTVALNWFLEAAYEQSAEILVIQENDELFAYRKGVMFQHVVNYANGNQMPVDLEELGRLALVAGANVFIIGEAKGPEICSAITLSNSGCRTAITIHSPSSTETIDKMADLAQRGYAQDYEQAKRMLKSFQTIVYMKDFAVQEISEITGYNEQTHEMEYRYIYRKDKEPSS